MRGKIMFTTFVTSCFAAITLLSGCGAKCSGGSPMPRSASGGVPPNSGVTSQTGTFYNLDNAYVLSVSIANDIVQYRVDDRKGNNCFSDNAGSVFSRWFFCWDNNSRLWVYSGDVGIFMWSKDGNGKWEKLVVGPKFDNTKMPKAFYTHLPSSLKDGSSRFCVGSPKG